MNIGYIIIKKINDFENIYSVNPLYVIIGEVDRLIEEKNRSSYLVFDSMEENKEVLTKYTLLWDGIKKKLRQLMVVRKASMVKISWRLNLNH